MTHLLRSAVDRPSRAAAVAACRDAAAAATRALAFDRAVELLDAALAMPGSDAALRCELLLDAADAEYAAGLADAAVGRRRNAAALAERLAERRAERRAEPAELLVRAALVVRGVDSAAVGAVVPGLCQRALAALPPDADAPRARVLAQFALTVGPPGGPVDVDRLSREALGLAERSGCPLAVSDALRARQSAASGPAGVTERVGLATRMLELAGSGGLPDSELWGRSWLIDTAFQLGDVRTLDAEVAELGRLAERLGWPLAHWHAQKSRAARALFAGRFDEVEDAVERARRAAEATSDFVFGLIIDAIDQERRALQGRLEDVVDMLRWGVRNGPLPVIWADLGRMLLQVGDVDGAREGYERVRPRLSDHPVEGTWLGAVRSAGVLAAEFGDHDVVVWCYQALLPFAAYHAASGSGTVYCPGSVSRTLGKLAAALGRSADAERHLADAIAMNDRAGALPYRTLAEVDLARLLADRGDLGRAAHTARRSAATARRLGMAPALAEADRLLATLRTARDQAMPLTPREREVLGLLAAGRSNR